MQIWIFSIITLVFSVTWSSEMILIRWFDAQETFLLLLWMLKTIVLFHMFVKTDTLFQNYLMKEQHLFEVL